MHNTEVLLRHLEKLVNFNPETRHQSNVRALLDYCVDVLAKTGAFQDIRIHIINGIHSMTASTQHTKQPKLLLQGHIDVVPTPDTLKFKLDKDIIYGRGVFDMLFATACYLTYCEMNANTLANLDIGLMLSGDEEYGGYNSVAPLLQQGYGAEICLLPDAGNGIGDMNVDAKGVKIITLQINGVSHHGSRPWEGDGAGNKIVRALHVLLERFESEFEHTDATCTVTILDGGDSVNKGPSVCRAHLDIRYRRPEFVESIQKIIDDICEKYNGEVIHEIVGLPYNLDTSTPAVKLFLEKYEAVIGRPITLTHAHGSSDARFFSEKSIPVIMYRPDGGSAHGDDEHLSLQGLKAFYDVMDAFINSYAVKDGQTLLQ